MLLSEERASSLTELRARLEANYPNMSSAELFGLIKILYKFQTEDEQRFSDVRMRNNAGFSITDAKKLTSFYNWYLTKKFYTPKQKEFIAALLKKHGGQLVNYWISTGKITKNGRGDYSYESKAEREAKRLAAANAAVEKGAAEFRQQQALQAKLQQTPEYQAAQRAKQNHGQLDFLNDLMK